MMECNENWFSKTVVLREQLGLCTSDMDTNILFTSTVKFICCDGMDQSL